MPDTTLLTLIGMGLPPYSARGLRQTLVPIDQASAPRRTADGGLINTAGVQFRKYKSTISCEDQQAPAIDGIWPGMIITVHCTTELARDEYASAERPVVPGSERSESGFVFYRPILEMMIINIDYDADEYRFSRNWSIDLEEV